MKTVLTTLGISLLVLAGCAGQKQAESNFIQENIDNAVAQETIQTDIIEKSGKILNPRTIDKDGNIVYVPIDDWCSGFFPGNIWHMYELTGDQKWLPLAEKYTEDLDSVQYLTWHHDVGFMIGSSYLNGYRFAGKEEYKPVIIQTAKSLSTRFRPAAGVLQSWDADKGWQAERGWKCPVIIDNMMNLELLFEASRLSGDSTFYNIARKHADTTMANHFREDNSCYHVVDYDPETGEVRKRQTAQGYADESAWARGQAWALYGYTMCYRYTHDAKYLEQAEKVYNFIWDEFCDWYIELSKYAIYHADENPKSANAALWTLKKVLGDALKLLHPYMPFVTEEIYSKLVPEEESLMMSSWPVYEEKWNDAENENILNHYKEIVRGVRNVRSEMNVPNSRKATIYVVCEDEKLAKGLAVLKESAMMMASAGDFIVQADKSGIADDAVSVVVPDATVYVPLEELIDFEQEKERLTKEETRLNKEIARSNGMLNNEKFVSKAPAAKVQEEREKLEKYEQMLAQVKERLAGLQKK